MNIIEGPPPRKKSGRPKGRMYDELVEHARENPGRWFSASTRKKGHAYVATQIKQGKYNTEGEVWETSFRQGDRPGYYRLYVCFLGVEQVAPVAPVFSAAKGSTHPAKYLEEPHEYLDEDRVFTQFMP